MAAPAGNQNAKKARIWAKAIEREVARLESGDLDKGLQRLAKRLVHEADTSDDPQWALKEIGDRMDGKPAQAIVGDDESPPVRFEKIERAIVRSENPDR